MSRRDRAAGEVLVRRLFTEHGAALLAYASRLLGDHTQGAEVVQEALVRAAFTDTRADLFEAVRDLAVARLRTRPQAVMPATGSMEMLRAVEALPPEERAVLNALYFQGRNVKEAATTLGMPAETVKTRSYQALRHLRGVSA
ncbi:sigma factor-like helix-turn-helix DNA-binding protein [Paractinoplanes atraurantiacus]|uniref:RNA polymerase sigma-70 factor, ECF subfamily n=1 Tax=Paractinoplanes atraurantiacus TaxID=1036182 RepID=A0A285H5V4_9ACTN|nr:sigma factor-like helix-turn-helix DNA-binding protein [Actinoplanes atraurantiacus]SNY30176.1 RNA polymerase sigma-70 factor, ECF subfamily [Actinoplanes atraurantiacus]